MNNLSEHGTNVRNCWEVKNCGREHGGNKVAELGECPASSLSMGHYCWVVAGTLCGGQVQGTYAQKQQTCLTCEVFKDYNPMGGSHRAQVQQAHAEEYSRFKEIVLKAARKD